MIQIKVQTVLKTTAPNATRLICTIGSGLSLAIALAVTITITTETTSLRQDLYEVELITVGRLILAMVDRVESN